jgi:hypothetical protein
MSETLASSLENLWNWSYTVEFTVPVNFVIAGVFFLVSVLTGWYIGHQRVTDREAPSWQIYLALLTAGLGVVFCGVEIAYRVTN